jgi:phosphoribosyl-ATP pyrophosphohydrolase
MSNNLVQDLFDVIKERKNTPVEQSYTNYLFEKGIDKILKKVGEEAAEVIISSKNTDNHETVMEICDLTYHVLVLMAEKGIELEDIAKELEIRRQKIGNKKPERKVEK